jgi:hypothetical protein
MFGNRRGCRKRSTDVGLVYCPDKNSWIVGSHPCSTAEVLAGSNILFDAAKWYLFRLVRFPGQCPAASSYRSNSADVFDHLVRPCNELLVETR